MLQLFPDGHGRELTLGPDVLAGQSPQIVVPRGAWFGCCLEAGAGFALLGTTMAPGFDASDYETGDRDRLTAAYPAYADLIRRLTRVP
jgi:predicted cupin superfamily sugar epimerase